MKEFNVTHAATETAFDRALLLKDGKDPQHFDPCGHFEVNTRNAAVITPFYTPEATVALTEKSISSMYSTAVCCSRQEQGAAPRH